MFEALHQLIEKILGKFFFHKHRAVHREEFLFRQFLETAFVLVHHHVVNAVPVAGIRARQVSLRETFHEFVPDRFQVGAIADKTHQDSTFHNTP